MEENSDMGRLAGRGAIQRLLSCQISGLSSGKRNIQNLPKIVKKYKDCWRSPKNREEIENCQKGQEIIGNREKIRKNIGNRQKSVKNLQNVEK